jgi:hypothetical protein
VCVSVCVYVCVNERGTGKVTKLHSFRRMSVHESTRESMQQIHSQCMSTRKRACSGNTVVIACC